MAAVTCQDIRELFSARVDDALSADERARLDAHLATCAECAREWLRFEGTVGLLRATEPARAPAGFVDRVMAARPQPWYRRLATRVLVPWPVKVPLEAAAIVLVAGLAVMVFQRSPELQQAARPSAPPSEVTATSRDVPAPLPGGTLLSRDATPPTPVTAPPAASAPAPASPSERGWRREGAPSEETKARPAEPAPADSRKEAATAYDRTMSAESSRPSPESRARSGEPPDAAAKKDAEPDRDGATARQSAPAPALRAMQKSGEVQRLTAATADVQARLVVADRVAAERTVRDLVARAAGQLVSRTDDGTATVLALAVPGDRWDDVKRDLENLGALRLEGRREDRTGLVRITLRLER
jgi:Putative zinc-finger